MLPILLVAAGALLLAGRKKKSKKTSSSRTAPSADKLLARHVLINGQNDDDAPQAGSRCDPPKGSPEFTFAAYGRDGKCHVFWEPGTENVARQFIDQELGKLSKQKQDALCARDRCRPDPYSIEPELLCEWIENPDRIAFIKKVVLAMYDGQIQPTSLPPRKQNNVGQGGSTYFIEMVWRLVSSVFATKYCGFNVVF